MIKFEVHVTHRGRDLEGVLVRVDNAHDVTGFDGWATVRVPNNATGYFRYSVEPYSEFWPTTGALQPSYSGFAERVTIELDRLPTGGFWWQEERRDPGGFAGSQVRVGIVDSGIGAHPNLSAVRSLGSYVRNVYDSVAQDTAGHGTNVAGLIAASPALGRPHGAAWLSEVLVVKVTDNSRARSNQIDLVHAINRLVSSQCDIINISMGFPITDRTASVEPSSLAARAILDAAEAGTICVAAAGNDPDSEMFPANMPEVVAVSAVGLQGWAPPNSTPYYHMAQSSVIRGNRALVVPTFAARGPHIDAVAPGVGLIAAAPVLPGWHDEPYRSVSGTSFAAPLVTAALAVSLSNDQNYLSLPRDRIRYERARDALGRLCIDIGLPSNEFGLGYVS